VNNNQRSKQKRLPLQGLIGLFSIILVSLTLISLVADWFEIIDLRWLDLISHFKLQYFIASFFFLLPYLYLKKGLSVVLLSCCLLINGYYVLPWYLSASEDVVNTYKESTELRIFHLNLLSSNTEYQAVIDLIRKEQPDIISLQEVSFAWRRELQVLLQDYPDYKIIPRQDNFGIAVLSRIPLLSIEEKDWGQTGGLPSFLVRFLSGERTIRLALLHPLPPINQIYYQQRNKTLKAVIHELKSEQGEAMLVGDLNISMWSPDYQILENDGFLKNARKGFGINSSWPSGLGYLGIPIDHVLASENLQVKNFRTSINVGSDHLALMVTLEFLSFHL